ncbi:MAG: hypothetical protein IKN63_00515 [Bacilli bacterium]|nr:hypothetical protein [Bacilli bacterium]
MNGNSSKQVLLSVLGIAVLVVAVVGVSFAFFTYAKVGNQNNTITTGEIYTYLLTEAEAQVTNAMPQTITSVQTTAAANENVAVIKFTVTGRNSTTSPINYTISLIPGTISAQNKKWFTDSEVGLIMSGTGTGHATDIAATTVHDKAGTGETINMTTDATSAEGDGITLGTGTFAAGGSTDIVHSYTVNLWIDGSEITISDTDPNADYCAHDAVEKANNVAANTGANPSQYGCETGNKVYSNYVYAAKIRVDASAVQAS